jgi:hypothetical protein
MGYSMEKIRRVVIFPEDLYQQLCAIAEREHRSMSAQVVHFVAAAVAREHEESSAKAEGR